MIHIKIKTKMATSPNNPDDLRSKPSTTNLVNHPGKNDPNQKERDFIDTKQPDPRAQPGKKSDPSGEPYESDDDFNGEEE